MIFFLYVAVGRDDVMVVDTASNSVVASIKTVGGATFAIAVTPDGKQVWATNMIAAGSVSVINTADNAVIGNIQVDHTPLGLALTPDGKRAYVANSQSNTVSVIDTKVRKVVATVQLGIAAIGASGVAISPDGNRLYVANFNSGEVSVIDTGNDVIVATIPVRRANPPVGAPVEGTPVVVSPDGKRAYVGQPGAVAVIDTASNTVVANVSEVSTPGAIAVTPDGRRLYVANHPDPTISVIDTAANAVVATITGFISLTGMAMTPDGKTVYVADQDSISGNDTGFIRVVDTDSNRVTATIKVENSPFGIALGLPR
jgi:YVTN family beta-propeller protein